MSLNSVPTQKVPFTSAILFVLYLVTPIKVLFLYNARLDFGIVFFALLSHFALRGCHLFFRKYGTLFSGFYSITIYKKLDEISMHDGLGFSVQRIFREFENT